jgi:hypothetical protein
MELTLAARLRRPERLAGFIALGVTAIAPAAFVEWRLGAVAGLYAPRSGCC